MKNLVFLNKKELIPMNKIKTTDWIKYIALFISLKMSAYADLMISGVVDGDLSGGNPKGIFITALNDKIFNRALKKSDIFCGLW